MTSTTDTDQHPDVPEISDLVEGLLSPSRTADLRGHLDGCTLCSDVHASLDEIRSLLGAVAGPPAMPDDVAGRIDAALAAEAPLAADAASTAAGPVEARSVSRETGRSEGERAGGEHTGGPAVEPEPSAAHRPSGRPRGATGPGRQPARRRTAILGTALGAAVVGMGVFLLQSVQPSQDAAVKMSDSSAGVKESSGQTFSEGTLEGQVDTLLGSTAAAESQGRRNGKKEPSADTQASPDSLSPEASSPRSPLTAAAVPVPPCVQQGTGRQTPALAMAEGRYQGTDAFLVVLPHATDTGRVQAYVVDAMCVDASPGVPGRLLLTRAYSRR